MRSEEVPRPGECFLAKAQIWFNAEERREPCTPPKCPEGDREAPEDIKEAERKLLANVILQRFLGLKLFSCEAVNFYFQTAACSEDSAVVSGGSCDVSRRSSSCTWLCHPATLCTHSLVMLQLEGNQVAVEGASRAPVQHTQGNDCGKKSGVDGIGLRRRN